MGSIFFELACGGGVAGLPASHVAQYPFSGPWIGLGTPKGSRGCVGSGNPLKASSGQKIGVYNRGGLCRLCRGCLSGSFCGPLDGGKASGGGYVAENL